MGLSAPCRDTNVGSIFTHASPFSLADPMLLWLGAHESRNGAECSLQKHKGGVHIHTCFTLFRNMPDAVMVKYTRVQEWG